MPPTFGWLAAEESKFLVVAIKLHGDMTLGEFEKPRLIANSILHLPAIQKRLNRIQDARHALRAVLAEVGYALFYEGFFALLLARVTNRAVGIFNVTSAIPALRI